MKKTSVFYSRIFAFLAIVTIASGLQPSQAQRLTLTTESEEAKTAFLTGLELVVSSYSPSCDIPSNDRSIVPVNSEIPRAREG